LRTTLQLRDVDGLSIRETAEILGVACGTVKAQLSRARARMRRSLSQRRSGTRRTAATNKKIAHFFEKIG
jgi:DNA-directed RNA polymerase specialized sigma24 family protein